MPEYEQYTKEQLVEQAKKLYLEKEDLNLQLQIAKGKLAKFLQDKYGSKSEKNISSEQLTLFNFDEVDELAVKEEHDETVEVKARKKRAKKKYALDDLPENIETETIVHDIEDKKCPECGSELHYIKTDVRKVLKYQPGYYKVEIHEYPVYGCRNCEKEDSGTIFSAEKTGFLFQKSPASASVVAHLMTQKYLLGLPLNRSITLMHSLGIMFSDQTCAKWVIDASEQYLTPLYNLMHSYLLKEDILNADETPYTIISGKKDEPGRKKKSKKTYIWMFRTGVHGLHQIILYHYGGGRQQAIAQDFLEGFEGYYHTDNYSGYNSVKSKKRVLCNVHARRYMADLYKQGNNYKRNPIVLNTLEIYREIFHRDSEILKEYGEDYEAIKKEREKRLRELFNILFIYLKTSKESVMKNSDLYKSINYIINAEEGLTRFFEDGRTELSNNLSERSLKPVINNRKSSLFYASEKGATGSCIITSVVQTAKENNLKVEEYITYVLEYMSKNRDYEPNDLEELMPWTEEMKERFQIKMKKPDSK